MASVRISQLATRTGVPATTLRFYETAGLLTADRRQAELAAFSARLAGVHERLSTPAPAGGCGPGCGCTTTASGPVPVTLSRRPEQTAGVVEEPWRNVPVACALDGSKLGERTAQWRRITARATDRRDTTEGVTLLFPATPEPASELAALAAAEQDCCVFFDFTLHLTPVALELTVRAPATAAALVADLFGVTA